jgi:pimeloyl-ACP methyl ester carboxylesterase
VLSPPCGRHEASWHLAAAGGARIHIWKGQNVLSTNKVQKSVGWIGAGGLELRGDVGGEGAAPVVVLLHGGGQTRHSWSGAMEALLGVGYRVINFDARGHGESDWSDSGNYSLEAHARDLLAIVANETSPVILVGASLGGATAIKALSLGFTPAALVLVDIVPKADRRGVHRIRQFMLGYPDGFGAVEDAVEAIANYNSHRPRVTDASGVMKNLRLRANGRLYWHWDPQILGDSEQKIAEFEATVDALKQARSLPVQLVRGGESDVVSNSGVDDLRDALPQLEVFDVAGAGHMVAGDRNDMFNEGVLNFLLRTVPPRTGPEPR